MHPYLISISREMFSNAKILLSINVYLVKCLIKPTKDDLSAREVIFFSFRLTREVNLVYYVIM